LCDSHYKFDTKLYNKCRKSTFSKHSRAQSVASKYETDER